MERATYPFSAIVNQEEMKLALLLAAIDWRLSVLLRGEKGSGKTTTARALAALLPPPAPFINLPIGATDIDILKSYLKTENVPKKVIEEFERVTVELHVLWKKAVEKTKETLSE